MKILVGFLAGALVSNFWWLTFTVDDRFINLSVLLSVLSLMALLGWFVTSWDKDI